MKRILLIICFLIFFSGLMFFFSDNRSIDNNITGNPDFEPTLGITKEFFFRRINELNEVNKVTLDPKAFQSKNNQLIFHYSDNIEIQADLYSNDEIGDLLIIVTHDLTKKELENEVKPIAYFLVQCIDKTSEKKANNIINGMKLSLEKSSYMMSEDTAYTYEFYYLESHGYIFAIRTSAMGH